MGVFWSVVPFSLIEVYRRFGSVYFFESTSEAPVDFYQTIRRNNPKDSQIYIGYFLWKIFMIK
jgi:hypothetical protein